MGGHRLRVARALLGAIPFFGMLPAALGADRVPIGLGDYFAVRVASDPQISPDGRRVAYVLTSPDLRSDRRVSSIRIVSTRDAADVPLAAGAQRDRHPRWAPAGDRLAFVRAVEGRFQIVVVARPPGALEVVAELPSVPIGLTWSPDGRELAYLASTPAKTRAPVASSPPLGAAWVAPPTVVADGGFQTATAMLPAPVEYFAYIVEAAPSSTPRKLPSTSLGRALPYGGAGLAWSPDGRRLLASLAPSLDHWKNLLASALYSIDVESGELRQVAAPATTVREPLIAPDGRLAFLAMQVGRANHYFDRRLYVGPRESGPFEWIHAELDRPVVAAAWAPNGRGLYGVFLDEGIGRLAWFGLDGRRRHLAVTGGGDASVYASGGSLSVARDGTVAFAFSDATTPSEIALVRPGSAPRVLTRNNAEYLATRIVNPVDSLRYRSADGQEDVHAWLVKPASAPPGEKLPTLVLLHGGQSADYGPDFDLDAQVAAAHGYLVVLPNYRYSGSYGRRFGTRLDYPVGTDADVLGAVDALIAQGIADPERLFIAGGSGGGLITAWTIGATDRFRAAAVWNAPIEWSSYVFEAGTGPTTLYGTFEALPWDAPDDYFRRSAYARVGSVNTPTLVTIGTLDRVTPISQSILYFNALQYRGVPSQLLVYPDEPHGIRAFPSHAMSHIAETLAWFARHGGPPLVPAQF